MGLFEELKRMCVRTQLTHSRQASLLRGGWRTTLHLWGRTSDREKTSFSHEPHLLALASDPAGTAAFHCVLRTSPFNLPPSSQVWSNTEATLSPEFRCYSLGSPS